MEWKEEFIQRLDSLDPTDDEIAAILHLKNINLPHSLFKYRPPNQFALDNLASNTVWLNTPTAGYEDPSELIETFDFTALTKTSEDLIARELKLLEEGKNTIPRRDIRRARLGIKIMKTLGGLLPSSIMSKIDRAERAAVNSIGEQLQAEIVKDKQDHMKICSFCESPFNLRMWEEYAGQHTGFCIEYNIANWPIDEVRRKLLYPVIYTDEVYDSGKQLIQAAKNGKFNFMYPMVSGTRKQKKFAFEEEWRLIIPIHGSSPENYFMNCQSKAYLGYAMTEEFKEQVIAICRKGNIQVFHVSSSLESGIH